MRGSKAKALRREAREVAASQGYPPYARLGVQHTTEKWVKVLDPKTGKMVSVRGKVHSTQVINNPESARGIYRALKGHALLRMYVQPILDKHYNLASA